MPPGIGLTYHAELDVTTLSAEYRWGDLVLAAETFAPAGYDNVFASPDLGMTFFDDSPDKVGYYASAAYRITDWLEIGAAYSEYYNNVNDKEGTDLNRNTGMQEHRAWLKDTTLTTRFDIAESWVVKLEGHFMDGGDIMLSEQNPEGTEREWFLFGAKVTYNF
jgi:long-subunit fatty acid transport protein